jgi:hypothetical protein
MSSSDAEAALQQLGVTQEQYIDFKDQQQTGRRVSRRISFDTDPPLCVCKAKY